MITIKNNQALIPNLMRDKRDLTLKKKEKNKLRRRNQRKRRELNKRKNKG